jgi:inner membrane protein
VDPLTHALLGSATARVVLARPLGRSAWLPGVAGALLPDVDALIRSGADPLLYAEFHRHFTHALAFIPIGGALAALPWLLARRTRPHWKAYLGAATAGYATHGLLDASTTYGTLLFWPFTDMRVAWNAISIVDPLFTLVLLLGVAVAVWRKTRAPAAAALLVCAAYLTTGAVQRDRALDAQGRIAAVRGHDRARGAVFPGFGNNLVWRSLYRAGDTQYMDRIRVPWFGASSWSPGPQVRLLREEELPPEVLADARLRRDFARFERFADGWVARAPGEPDVIGDGRYSSRADRFEPVWGIRFTPGSDVPIEWVDRSRQRRIGLRALWTELRGADPRYRTITPVAQ